MKISGKKTTWLNICLAEWLLRGTTDSFERNITVNSVVIDEAMGKRKEIILTTPDGTAQIAFCHSRLWGWSFKIDNFQVAVGKDGLYLAILEADNPNEVLEGFRSYNRPALRLAGTTP